MKAEARIEAAPSPAEPDMGHEFDGIRELDNRLPNWWLATLYLSIVFSFGYWMYYHVFQAGPLQMDEYHQEMARADEAAAALAEARGAVDDDTLVAMAADGTQTAEGQVVFGQYCAACHGAQGEGGIGPNLTDKNWLHGGKPTQILEVVASGVPAAGMPAWKPILGNSKVEQVTAYLLTLKGKHLPGKAPEGSEE